MRPAPDQAGPGTAWQAGDVPTPPRSRYGPAALLLVAALVAVAATVTVARRDPPVPQVRLSLDRAGSAVSFGPDAVIVTPALTASPTTGDTAATFPVLGIEGPGLAPGPAGVDRGLRGRRRRGPPRCGAAGGRRTALPLGEADGSWRGLVGAVCWQQGLSRDVAVDLVPVAVAAGRPPAVRRMEVDLRIRNGTAERIGLVLTVPPAGGVLVRPDGRPRRGGRRPHHLGRARGDAGAPQDAAGAVPH